MAAAMRATIFVMHDKNSDDFDVVSAWLEKWEGKVRVANHSTGGYEHIWDVEGPQEAISELPKEWLAESRWSNRRLFET